jgi:hypothetical protein
MHAVLQQVFDSYVADLSGKPAEWCQLHPLEDERLWSTEELIEHLVLTCRGSSRVLQKRLDRGEPTGDRSTPTEWVLQMVMLSFGQMPRGVPAQTFARPGQLHWLPMTGTELIETLRQEIDQMDALLDQSRQRFGLQRVASHYVLGPIRPDQWRRFHVVHMRHHLGQLRRIESSAGKAAAPVARVRAAAR